MVPAKKALTVLMPVSSRGAPGSRGPVDGVSSADCSGGGGGRTAIAGLGSDPTVLDFQAVSGPLAAASGTYTRNERVSVELTRTFTLSRFVLLLPWKTTLRTPRRFLPATRTVPPARTRFSPEHCDAHLTLAMAGTGV